MIEASGRTDVVMRIGILGAGLTGLTIGYLFRERGIEFKILEKESECGGLMRTLIEHGFTFDYGGSHILFSKDKEALDLMVSLLGENKVTNRRNTKILYKGRYVKYPFENGLADLPLDENFECLYTFVENLVKRERGELRKPRNLKDWFCYTFGKGIAEKYMIPYNEKIWKHPIQRISLEWVERIPNPPIEDIVKSSLGIQTEGYTHQLNFQYPAVGGIQAIIRALEDRLGGHIDRQFEVKSIRKDGPAWIVSDGGKSEVFHRLISTIPVHDLFAALKNGGTKIPDETLRAVNKLKYNSLITIMIGVKHFQLNDLSWLYIPDGGALTHRVSFPSNFSSKAAPKGTSSIMAEITCNYGDKVWQRDDDSLIDETIDSLHELEILKKDDVCFKKTRRSKYAYVISDLDFAGNIRMVARFLNKIAIDSIGRFAEFRYMNMDACVRRAIDYVASMNIRKALR